MYLVVSILVIRLRFVSSRSFVFVITVGAVGYVALRGHAIYNFRSINVFVATVEARHVEGAGLCIVL